MNRDLGYNPMMNGLGNFNGDAGNGFGGLGGLGNLANLGNLGLLGAMGGLNGLGGLGGLGSMGLGYQNGLGGLSMPNYYNNGQGLGQQNNKNKMGQ